MSAPREVEIKFRVSDAAALARRLRAAGFRRVTPPTHEINTLYDVAGSRLRKHGELLRLRKYGDAWVLTHKAKGKTGRHKTRVELETHVADGAAIDAILAALGFWPTFRYEKYRAEWSDGNGHVVVDETPIGNFGEIEGAPRWIDGTAKALGIAASDYITDTYAGLFVAWKRQAQSTATEMTFRATGVKAKSARLAGQTKR